MTLLKGALVSFTPTFLVPLPNITVFQFNPETMTHTWSQPDRAAEAAPSSSLQSGDPQAVPGMPGEEFSLTVVFDSNQDLEDQVPVSAQLGAVSGIYARLAALEMMLYPVGGNDMSNLLGQASAALGLGGSTTSSTSCTTTVPDSSVPVVLFVWGAFRIIPVRLTALTITEKLYDEILNPVHAEVQLRLRVLTPAELNAAKANQKVLADLGIVAYTYTLGVRQVGAVANLGNALVGLAEIL